MSCVKKESKDKNVIYFMNYELEPPGFHNPDGPAVIMDNCSTWWLYGLRHRIDGPAIEWKIKTSSKDRWFYYGKEVNCSNQEEFDKILNLKAFW